MLPSTQFISIKESFNNLKTTSFDAMQPNTEHHLIEQVCIVVTPCTHIREMFGANFHRHTVYPDYKFIRGLSLDRSGKLCDSI
jgi:hypothetical protein